LELLAASLQADWLGLIGAVILEETIRDHAATGITKIEEEAGRNDRLRVALRSALHGIPEAMARRMK
jgi:hypothetical protein